MRYFYERPEIVNKQKYGMTVASPHPMYDSCTLYLKDGIGLAVVQKRFDAKEKKFFYSELDDCIANDIFENENFPEYFLRNARPAFGGLYPTKEVRSVMWSLRMKPLKKEWWEEDPRMFL